MDLVACSQLEIPCIYAILSQVYKGLSHDALFVEDKAVKLQEGRLGSTCAAWYAECLKADQLWFCFSRLIEGLAFRFEGQS